MNAVRQIAPAGLELEFLRLLPGKGLVGAKVTVLGSLEVDGSVQFELADNHARTKIEILVDNVNQLIRCSLRGAISIDKNGQRLGDTDGVRELDKGAASETGIDKRLGNPTAHVRGRAIDL